MSVSSFFWGGGDLGSLRQVEPLGSPQSPADEWVEGTDPG